MAGYFQSVADALLNGMGTNLFAKTGSLIAGIAPVFSISFGIYILLVVLNAYGRGFDENVVDLTKRILGWLIVIACAFNAGQYAKIANIAYNLPDGVSGLLGSGEYTASAVDTGFNSLLETVSKMWELFNSYGVTEVAEKITVFGIMGGVIFFGGLFFLITGAFYLVAKLSLAMVIMIGPIFIGCMLFPATRQWGMNWIGQIMNYTVTVVFYTILGVLQLDYFNNHLVNVLSGGDLAIAMLIPVLCMFFVSTCIFVIVAWNIPSIASALTGGAGANGFSRTVISMANWASKVRVGGGGAKSGGSIAK